PASGETSASAAPSLVVSTFGYGTFDRSATMIQLPPSSSANESVNVVLAHLGGASASASVPASPVVMGASLVVASGPTAPSGVPPSPRSAMSLSGSMMRLHATSGTMATRTRAARMRRLVMAL